MVSNSLAEARQLSREGDGTMCAIDNGSHCAIISGMNTTITVDKAGRIVIPKSVRERMRIAEGSRLVLELCGDRIELRSIADEARVERKGKLRVILGGEPFDAGEAIRDDREERLRQLASRKKKEKR